MAGAASVMHARLPCGLCAGFSAPSARQEVPHAVSSMPNLFMFQLPAETSTFRNVNDTRRLGRGRVPAQVRSHFLCGM